MFAVGVLAIVFGLFLPGAAILAWARPSLRASALIALAFPLSFGATHVLVAGLVLLGAFNKYSLFIAVLLSIVALILGFTRRGAEGPRASAAPWRLTDFILVAYAGQAVLISAAGWAKRLGTVFGEWDAVVSWNRWALDWTSGILPRGTWEYPQAVPTLYALTYKMIDAPEVQFFAKAAVMAFYPIALFSAGALGIYRESWRRAGLYSCAFLAFLLHNSQSVYSGYADTPLAAILAASQAVWIWGVNCEDEREGHFALNLASCFAAIAALTKQGGLPWALLMPAFTMSFYYLGKKPVRTCARLWLMPAVAIVAWYGYKLIQFRMGLDSSVVSGISQYYGVSIWLRPAHAWPSFYEMFARWPHGFWYFSAWALAIFASSSSRAAMWLSIYSFGMSIAWVFGTSYDARNLGGALPALALAAGLGLEEALDRAAKRWPRFRAGDRAGGERIAALLRRLSRFFLARKALAVPGLAAAVVAATAWGTVEFPSSRLTSEAVRLEKRIGSAEINDELFRLHDAGLLKGKVLTSYAYAGFLPGLQDHWQVATCHAPLLPFQEIPRGITVGWILSENYCSPSWTAELDRLVDEGVLERGYRSSAGSQFYKVKATFAEPDGT